MEYTNGNLRQRPWLKLAVGLAAVVLAALAYLVMSPGKPAPAVQFTDLKGQKVSLESLRGKVVMVNFWATSCTTCIKEMPELVETYEKYKDKGLEFVAVAMSYDRPDYVVNYAETRALPFRVALDVKGDLAESFGNVKLTPTTFVIDKQGNIVKRYVGIIQFNGLHLLLDRVLAA